MPEPQIQWFFLLTAPVLELTPGPNMAGLAAVAGIGLGLVLQAGLVALGAAAVLQAFPVLAGGLHLAGIAYLVRLAWENRRVAGTPAHHLPGGGETGPDGFRRGLIANLLNPKAGCSS